MRPVLTVEGKRYEAEIFSFGYRDENGKHHAILAENVKKVEWQDRYQPVYDALDSFIVSNQYDIQNLATEIADNVEPFMTNPKIKEREILKQRTFGLMDAQDMVHAFMEEDVDLNGGEEVE